MGMRNYCAGYYDEETGKLNFWIQAEKEVGKKGTMGYLVDVPRLVFSQVGTRLYSHSKKDLMPVLNEHHQHGSSHHHHYQQSSPSPPPLDNQHRPVPPPPLPSRPMP